MCVQVSSTNTGFNQTGFFAARLFRGPLEWRGDSEPSMPQRWQEPGSYRSLLFKPDFSVLFLELRALANIYKWKDFTRWKSKSGSSWKWKMWTCWLLLELPHAGAQLALSIPRWACPYSCLTPGPLLTTFPLWPLRASEPLLYRFPSSSRDCYSTKRTWEMLTPLPALIF